MRTATDLSASLQTSSPVGGRVRQLDGLRALAIVLVLIFHGLTPVPFGGFIGVDLFFVLSGYLITTLLLIEIARYQRIRFRRFYLRRLIRLYPPLLAVIAILVIPAALLQTEDPAGFWINTAAALTYTTPLLTRHGNAFGPWLHTWSLGIEEIFYLIWPVVLLLITLRVKSTRMRAGLLLAGGVLVIFGNFFVTPDSSIGENTLRGGGLFLGSALAILLFDRPALRVPSWLGLVGLAVVGIAVFVGTFPNSSPAAVAIACVGATLVIASIVASPDTGLARVLAWKPAAYLGLISYEVYLWHYPLLYLGAEWSGSDLLHVAPIAIPLSLLLGAATERLLRPLLRRLKAAVPY